MTLEDFDDVHSHYRKGPRTITNLEPGSEIETPYGEAWYSAGIHPWDTIEPADWQWLERIARDERVVAIGEAGIDRLRGADIPVQEEIFSRQALLAEQLGKPLIVHCVRAWGELLKIHKEINPKVRWMVHGFHGKAALARQLLQNGIELSASHEQRIRLSAAIPEARIHSESDVAH